MSHMPVSEVRRRWIGLKEMELLKKVPIFKGLSEEQIKLVAEIVDIENVSEGEVIIREGEQGDKLYILAEGTVEVSKALTLRLPGKGADRREKSLVRLHAADKPFFGEMALLEGEERSATVTALTRSRFFVINRADLEALAESRPEIGYRIVRNVAEVLCSRLRKMNVDLLKLATALSLALER